MLEVLRLPLEVADNQTYPVPKALAVSKAICCDRTFLYENDYLFWTLATYALLLVLQHPSPHDMMVGNGRGRGFSRMTLVVDTRY